MTRAQIDKPPTVYSFSTARRIVAGARSLDTIGTLAKSICEDVRRVLIVTQPSMTKNGAAARTAALLAAEGIEAVVRTGIRPEPTQENIESFHRALDGESFDAYIGLGGGSVLDATKLLAVLRTNAGGIEGMLGADRVRCAGLPTLLVPTTSGTGSEVTPNAIVTLPEQELKVAAVSSHLLPAAAILDPELTLGLPDAITAATGMDAFTHALESYLSNKANPMSDMFALESMRRISRGIIRAYRHGDDLAAREDMLIGSMYGGMALTGAGTAAVHALAYPLGGKFGIAHGVANAMLLRHVMEFNMDAIQDRMRPVAQAMGIPGADDAESEALAERVVDRISSWTEQLRIPQDLSAYGIAERDIPELAAAASKVTRLLQNNPKPVSVGDMERMYRRLLPR
ncbi:iron-containing alcohol dehydrogenase [Paenibacillus sp.]|uniref:iron-containing alcohol dehydrogenase n=1 Tax=Paenibacillus sp. TaxID=58172 RepID=UPI002D406724|nr:iron-containing alcohol dehydrogenase [Paenibacillus sp.]HZG55020.1 iron-containing alcohol dehydrogenase [Paenibacillus sp.]